jgi:uncharacterized membrane protein
MSWLHRYHLRLYFHNSIWILPALSIPVALISVSLLTRYEHAVGSHADIGAETARAIMSTVAASTFTLVVLVASAVLVAVQLASAQLTPRLIALIYRNPYRKVAFSIFVLTFTFAVGVLVRIEDTVPKLGSYAAAYGFLFDLALFFLFIDSMGKTLRPSSAARGVGLAAREVIRAVYPSRLNEDSKPQPIKAIEGKQPRIVLNVVDGTVLAFDLKGLLTQAERTQCVIELVPEVGDFIAQGDPLFRIYQGGNELSDARLRNHVAVGGERTLDQDPLFSFRILVDIASKALSPAINDPTTAVLMIDQIHHLLRDIGNRNLADGHEEDSTGKVRVVYRTPDWEDFVLLGTTEIRQYGRDSIQVQRRLRAMLKDLIDTLPEQRHPVLRKELALLSSLSRRAFPDLDDQALAESSDLQGIGGSPSEISENHHDATAMSQVSDLTNHSL